jgi:multiple sugar transport system substrate-binding protein
MVDAIYSKKFMPDKMITWKTPDAYNAFLQGNAVFLRGWTDFAPQAEGASSKIKGMWGVKTIPAAAGKKPAACLGNWNLAINANSKNPDAAWKVVDYFLSVEAQKALTLGTARPPARKDVYSDKDVLTNSPSFNIMNDVFATAKPRPVSPAYPQVSSEVIQDQVSKTLANQVSPKDAAKNMSDAAKKIFEKFKA